MPPEMTRPVKEVFDAYTGPIRDSLLKLRSLVFEVASETDGVGPLTESLKWGQPSYSAEQTGSGTAVRLHNFESDKVAVFVNCQTSLIETFRGLCPELNYSKNRAIVLTPEEPLPIRELALFIEMAFTYKLSR